MDHTRLETVRPFERLSEAERKMLAGVLDELKVSAGDTLVRQGEYGYEFMVIEQGTVDVIHDGEKIDEMGPGDFFGELAVLEGGGQRNATIVATSPVTIMILSAHHMRTIRQRMPRVGEQIDAVIAERTH